LVGPLVDAKCDDGNDDGGGGNDDGKCRAQGGEAKTERVPQNAAASLEEIACELRQWTSATWYQWTRPDFVRPAYYVSKEKLSELHWQEKLRQLMEDERARKKKLTAKERPIREDRYVDGHWRRQKKEDRERLEWNRQHAEWNRQHAEWKQRRATAIRERPS
jgi:hypothetical protein